MVEQRVAQVRAELSSVAADLRRELTQIEDAIEVLEGRARVHRDNVRLLRPIQSEPAPETEEEVVVEELEPVRPVGVQFAVLDFVSQCSAGVSRGELYAKMCADGYTEQQLRHAIWVLKRNVKLTERNRCLYAAQNVAEFQPEFKPAS